MMISRGLALSPVVLVLFALPGCSNPEAVGVPHTHDHDAEIVLCGLCGHVKGGEDCCQEGATICTVCGKHKGSLLCCSPAISGVRDIILCRKCGEVAFTDACCKDAENCPKCDLHLGSPGCCKINDLAIDQSKLPHASHVGH